MLKLNINLRVTDDTVIANSGISKKLLVGGEFSDPTGKLTLIVLLLILY